MNTSYRQFIAHKNTMSISFRTILIASLLVILTGGTAWAAKPFIPDSNADVTVYKTATCGCCGGWTKYLEKNGLKVKVVVVNDTSKVRNYLGVPSQLASCHTAIVGNYWVEGHVPADLVSRLVHEQPANIKGFGVPGMQPGSQGMDIPNAPPYAVYSVNDEGEISRYATRKGPGVQ